MSLILPTNTPHYLPASSNADIAQKYVFGRFLLSSSYLTYLIISNPSITGIYKSQRTK